MSAVSDVLIIGGGPAGLTAALYAARAGLAVKLFERQGCGGQAAITDLIENYPGFPDGVNGYELSTRLEAQAVRFGAQIEHAEIVSARLEAAHKSVTTADAVEHRARAIIIACGATARPLGVPGEKEFIGRGVSYCATCDGPFFRGKRVVVAGGGDSAVQEALFLTRFAASVTIVHRRDALRAVKALSDRVIAEPRITVRWNTTIDSIGGAAAVDHVMLRDVASGSQERFPADGVFVFIGWDPNSAPFSSLVACDTRGYIATNDHMETSVPGVFACGDVRAKLLRQVVTACGDGATAAFAAQEYLDKLL